MELGTSGTLYDIVREKKYLKEENGKIVVKQLCQGVDYLHQNKILHRDLKLENILYHFVQFYFIQGMIKICDFGWSTVSEEMR